MLIIITLFTVSWISFSSEVFDVYLKEIKHSASISGNELLTTEKFTKFFIDEFYFIITIVTSVGYGDPTGGRPFITKSNKYKDDFLTITLIMLLSNVAW